MDKNYCLLNMSRFDFLHKFSVRFKLILMHTKVLINAVIFKFSANFLGINTTKKPCVKF